RHTRFSRDWSSDVCSSDLILYEISDYIFDIRMPVAVAGKLLLYKLPEVIALTIPIGVLFATLLSLGRLTRDSELAAMRSAGIPRSEARRVGTGRRARWWPR